MTKGFKSVAIVSSLAILAYLVYKSTKTCGGVLPAVPANVESLKVGSFSKEIERLQQNVNNIAGREVLEVTGAYSRKMQEVVRIVFNDSDILLDKVSGELELKQLQSLNYILENIKNNIVNV